MLIFTYSAKKHQKMISNQYKNSLKIFIFLIGVGLLIHGLLTMKYEYELTPFILFSCLFFISLAICRFLKISVSQLGISYISLLAILSGNIAPLFIVLLITFSAYLLGHRICLFFKILDIDYSIQFLLGIGIFGTLIGLGAHWPIAYPLTYGLMIITPFIGLKNPETYLRKIPAICKPVDFNDPLAIFILKISIVSCITIYFIYTLLPELGYDALVYHLFIPVQMSSIHTWGFDVNKYIWAVFPLLGDWIFSLTYMLSGETATRIINLLFILIGARLIYLFSCELNISKLSQYLCVAIYFSNPLTFAMASTLYVESIWGAYFMAATLMIIQLLSSKSTYSIKKYTLIALMLGFSAAAKMATLVLTPIILLITILLTPIFSKKNRSTAFISLILFCLVGLIPNITAWIKTKNPFFPILNNVFTSPLFPNFKFTPPHSEPITWNLLFDLTFKTGKYLESIPGGIGFHLILFFPIILAAAIFYGKENKKFLTLLTICIFGVILIFITTSYLRYAYPLFTMLALCVVASTEIIKPSKFLLTILRFFIILIAIFNIVFLTAGAWNYRTFNFPAIISKEKQRQYLMQMNSLRIAVEVVNQLNINNNPVGCFTQPLLAGLKSEALIPNWYNEKFQNEALAAKDASDMSSLLKKYNINYVIIQKGASIFNISNDLEKIIINATYPVAQIGTEIVIRSALEQK